MWKTGNRPPLIWNKHASRSKVSFVNKLRLLLISSALLLPVLLFVTLPIALAQMLTWPVYRTLRPLLKSEAGGYVVLAILLSWALWSVLTGAVLVTARAAFLRHRVAFCVGIGVLAVWLLFQIRGSHSRTYEGIWERGFEHSDFFYNGNCDRPRYWLVQTPEVLRRVNMLGSPMAVRLKFVGTTTSIGEYGHLGQYLREIHVEQIISAEPTQSCIHR